MKNKASFSILILTAISLFSILSEAQTKSVLMDHNGVNGRWFPKVMLDEIQSQTLEFKSLRDKTMPLLREELRLHVISIENLKLAISVTTDALEINKSALKVADEAIDSSERRAIVSEKRAADAEAREGKWYRKPVTLIGAGVVITVVVEIVIYSFVN